MSHIFHCQCKSDCYGQNYEFTSETEKNVLEADGLHVLILLWHACDDPPHENQPQCAHAMLEEAFEQ